RRRPADAAGRRGRDGTRPTEPGGAGMTEPLRRGVRQDVAGVGVRYATGIDSRYWDLFRTCFTDDCEADYGDIGVWHGADEITAWMREVHEACGPTPHRINNIVVTEIDRP